MLSLRDKLRATQNAPRRPAAVKAGMQDCFVRETCVELSQKVSLPDGIFPLMQGDEQLPEKVEPGELLFLDTETTGLSTGAGTVAFLVGTGVIEGHTLVVRQYLMRDYNEERFVLLHVRELLQQCRMLVTFNGKSFDMPLLRTRFILQRIPCDTESLPHADMLHTARRVWKLRLRCCSLSALEEHIYHQPRQNDLPGSQVPQRYFDYLKSKDFSLLEDILSHNAQDIITLARLVYTLSDVHINPLSAEHVQDIFSLGCVLEKRGKDNAARMCYRAADAGSLSTLSRERLARNLCRAKEPKEAALVYEKMIASRQGGAMPYIALCKLLEHRMHDIPRALDVARRGLMFLSDQPQSAVSPQHFDDLTHRYARLMQKMRI